MNENFNQNIIPKRLNTIQKISDDVINLLKKFTDKNVLFLQNIGSKRSTNEITCWEATRNDEDNFFINFYCEYKLKNM